MMNPPTFKPRRKNSKKTRDASPRRRAQPITQDLPEEEQLPVIEDEPDQEVEVAPEPPKFVNPSDLFVDTGKVLLRDLDAMSQFQDCIVEWLGDNYTDPYEMNFDFHFDWTQFAEACRDFSEYFFPQEVKSNYFAYEPTVAFFIWVATVRKEVTPYLACILEPCMRADYTRSSQDLVKVAFTTESFFISKGLQYHGLFSFLGRAKREGRSLVGWEPGCHRLRTFLCPLDESRIYTHNSDDTILPLSQMRHPLRVVKRMQAPPRPAGAVAQPAPKHRNPRFNAD